MMEPKTLSDGCGNEFYVMEWNGEYLPPFCVQEKMEAVQNMPFRPDDVIICSYPKTGTHWAQEMVTLLLAQKAEPPKDDKVPMLEFPFTSVEDYASMPSPRTMTTHLRFHNLPKGILENKCRLVVIERNIKDTAVSLFNFTSLRKGLFIGDWNGFVPMFLQGNCLNGSYFDHVKDFRQAAKDHPELPIFFLRYEQIKKDHLGEVGRLSQFLGLDSSSELLAGIARLTDFQSMQKYKNEMTTEWYKQKFTSGKSEMYRKGEVGDWKNWFTAAQSELFDAEYLKQMGEPFQEMP